MSACEPPHNSLPRLHFIGMEDYYDIFKEAMDELKMVPVSDEIAAKLVNSIVLGYGNTIDPYPLLTENIYKKEEIDKCVELTIKSINRIPSTDGVPHSLLFPTSPLYLALKSQSKIDKTRMQIQFATDNYILSVFPDHTQYYSAHPNLICNKKSSVRNKKRVRDNAVDENLGYRMQVMSCLYFIVAKLVGKYYNLQGLDVMRPLQCAIYLFIGLGQDIKRYSENNEDITSQSLFREFIAELAVAVFTFKHESHPTTIDILAKTSSVRTTMPSRIDCIKTSTPTQTYIFENIVSMTPQSLEALLVSQHMLVEVFRMRRFLSTHRATISSLTTAAIHSDTTPIHLNATLSNITFPFLISIDANNRCYVTGSNHMFWHLRSYVISKLFVSSSPIYKRTTPLFAPLSSMYFKSVVQYCDSSPDYFLSETSKVQMRAFFCNVSNWLYTSSTSDNHKNIMDTSDPFFCTYAKLHLALARYQNDSRIIESTSNNNLCDAILSFIFFRNPHFVTSTALDFLRALFAETPALSTKYPAISLFLENTYGFVYASPNTYIPLSHFGNQYAKDEFSAFECLASLNADNRRCHLLMELYNMCCSLNDIENDEDAQFLFENIQLESRISLEHPTRRYPYDCDFTLPQQSFSNRLILDTLVHRPHFFTRIFALLEWRSTLKPDARKSEKQLRIGLFDIAPDYPLSTHFLISSSVYLDSSFFVLPVQSDLHKPIVYARQYLENILLGNENILFRSSIYYAYCDFLWPLPADSSNPNPNQ